MKPLTCMVMLILPSLGLTKQSEVKEVCAAESRLTHVVEHYHQVQWEEPLRDRLLACAPKRLPECLGVYSEKRQQDVIDAWNAYAVVTHQLRSELARHRKGQADQAPVEELWALQQARVRLAKAMVMLYPEAPPQKNFPLPLKASSLRTP